MVMVLLMVTYAFHRYLNEMLRTDTGVVAFNMTFSQNISILLLIGAGVLAAWILLSSRRPAVQHQTSCAATAVATSDPTTS
jgi:prolipoprotein diacylglyceryltransferase